MLDVSKKYGAILADPPWHFDVWSLKEPGRHATAHYGTMSIQDIYGLPVRDLAAKDCVLFLWVVWPMLEHGLKTIDAWGFKYKTCGFAWMKSSKETNVPIMGTGYWTRANTEVCLLATKGKPKRISAGVAQAIYEPRREHSRKPDCINDRIERLVNGPYLELFARRERPGWDVWGNQTTKFNEAA